MNLNAFKAHVDALPEGSQEWLDIQSWALAELHAGRLDAKANIVEKYWEAHQNEAANETKMRLQSRANSPTEPLHKGKVSRAINKAIYNKDMTDDPGALCLPTDPDDGQDGRWGAGVKPLESCRKCPYFNQPYVGGRGDCGNGIMLVGDGPGETDAKTGRVYSGKSGVQLEKVLSKYAGVDTDRCRYTNVVRCHVPRSRKPTKKAVTLCSPLLAAEIEQYGPSTVISIGETALNAFYSGSLKSYHGQKVELENFMLVPTYKPDAIEKSPEVLTFLVDDLVGFKKRPVMRKLECGWEIADRCEVASGMSAMDIETTGLEMDSAVLGMSVSESPDAAVYLPGKSAIRFLQGNEDPGTLLFHNAKFDAGVLMSNGVPKARFADMDDTMVLAYVMNRRHLGLKDLVQHELNLEMVRFEDVAKSKSLVGVPDSEIAPYCCSDACGTLMLWDKLWRETDRRQRDLYNKVERPLPLILAEMQLKGVYLDVPYMEQLGADMERQLEGLEQRMLKEYGLAPEVLRSPQQLGDFVYKKLRLKAAKYTDTGQESTDKYAFERLEGQHPVIDLILQYRRLAVLNNTFVNGALKLQRLGLVYPNFGQVNTTTGRMNSSKPNMQNLPKREDKTIRRGYVAPEGYVVAAFDNSQIDLRSLAYLSKDAAMMDVFDRDGDIHSETAEYIWGSAETDHRRVAKTANFLVVFGGGPSTLAAKAKIPEARAADFLAGYEARYPGVFSWIKRTREEARKDGFVETPYGRRRYIPKLYSPNPKLRSEAEREAQNAPVQGCSSDILKLQMSAVADIALPFGQIHDELNFYLPKEGLNEIVAEIRERMESVECPFKLKVEAAVGPNMGDLEEWNHERSDR